MVLDAHGGRGRRRDLASDAMSLINQVLQDLERRHGGGVEVRELVRAVRPLPRRRAYRTLWIVVSGCAASAVLLWVLFKPQALPVPALWTAVAAPVAPQSGAHTAPAVELQPSGQSATGRGSSEIVVVRPDGGSVDGIPQAAAPAGTNPRSLVTPATRPPARSAAAAGAPATPLAPRAQSATPPGSVALTPAAGTGPQRGREEESVRGNAVPQSAAKTGHKADATSGLSGGHADPSAPLEAHAEHPEADGTTPEPSIQKQERVPSQRERAEAEVRRGLTALQSGDVPEAEDRLHQALAIDPLADKARQALVGLYVERGRSEDAERLLEERLRIDSHHAGFAMATARLQLERGANAEALATLERSARYGEGSAGYQAIFANAFARMGQHKEAAERYQAATRLAPQSALWLLGLGVELKADHRPTGRARPSSGRGMSGA